MGLAASQARLLTITSRKSDCEYESMSLSHQKIALSRDMNAVSSEYQNALNQTKIIYDFYGSGDKGLQLSYGLLTSPSELNEYRPSTITDQAGRVVLSPDMAAAAMAAGIPHEGLGSTPSSDIRDLFINGLVQNGTISRTIGNNIQSVQYNANAGFGDINLITYTTKEMSLNDFIDNYLDNVKYDFRNLTTHGGAANLTLCKNDRGRNSQDITSPADKVISLKDIIQGHYALYGTTCDHIDMDTYGGNTCAANFVTVSDFWDTLFDSLEAGLDMNDVSNQAALNFAKQEILKKVITLGANDFSNFARTETTSSTFSLTQMNERAKEKIVDGYDYIGHIAVFNHNSNDDYNDGYAIDLSLMAKAFLTYFAMYKEGLGSTDYKVTNQKSSSNFVDLNNFAVSVVEDVDTSGNNLLIANFYDMLFNQIATNGWVTNENVRDNEYLAEMLRNGSMFLSSLSDDNFYYQSNYATNKYIKEITDEENIAKAEAKYLREKEKIQNKENIIDMKMKNLDTEITALTTEYNTVKTVITNSVKNSFTRYDA